MSNKLLLPLVLVSTLARAETLEEKTYWKGQMDYVQRELASANKACGTTFAFDWVDRETLRAEVTKTKHSPNGVCNMIISEVAQLCRRGADEKAAVQAKIKGFTCGFAKPRRLDLRDGIVHYSGNNSEPNFTDWAKPWLMKHL